MARTTVQLRGMNDVQRKLQAIGRAAAGDAVVDAARAGSAVLREEFEERAPRRTGDLSQHIEEELVLVSRTRVEVEVGPDGDHFYGGIIEVGSAGDAKRGGRGRFAPQPWMRPGMDAREDDVRDAVGGSLKRSIEQAAR